MIFIVSESIATEQNIKDSLPKHENIQVRDQSEKGKKEKKQKKLKLQGAEKGVESTGDATTTQEPQVLPERKGGPFQKLLIKPGGLWYDLVSNDSNEKVIGPNKPAGSRHSIRFRFTGMCSLFCHSLAHTPLMVLPST